MQSDDKNDKSISKQTKRVRFHEQVEIIEIERIDQHSSLMQEGSKRKATATTKRESLGDNGSLYSITRSESSTTTSSSSDLLSDRLTLCSASNSHRRYTRLPDPVQNPFEIPPMLFNMLPLPNDTTNSSGNNCDHRWKEINKNRFQSFSSFSLEAPVRAPSMDQIIDSALAILEDTPTLKGATALKRQYSDALADRKNDSWEIGYDSAKERWRDHPQSPPKIPRRKISMDDVSRRKI